MALIFNLKDYSIFFVSLYTTSFSTGNKNCSCKNGSNTPTGDCLIEILGGEKKNNTRFPGVLS